MYNTGVMQRLIFLAACGIALISPMFGQGNAAADASNANEKSQSYDTVSIKPHKSGDSGGWMRGLADGFEWSNVSLYSLVQNAYDIQMESQVSGLPGWAKSEAYDIVAKVDAPTAERWKHLKGKERWAEEQLMMRSILEERCQFKAHQETKELPIYELVIAKGGLKMKEAAPGEAHMEEMNRGRMVARAKRADTIASAFTGAVGRLIVDKTGLGDKKFDFELKWTEDDRQATEDSPDAAPSLFTALEEQLGLKLVPAKGPVQILVIDHMERPSPN